MPFQIIRNDITRVNVDAIVNPVNPHAEIGRGAEFAIYDRAGRYELLKERRKLGVLYPGDVGITSAFNLPAKYIIHASGPLWRGGNYEEREILRECYDNALKLALECNCSSIAFPLLATGTYGFPKEIGMSIAVEAFTDFLKKHEMEILLVVFGSDALSLSGLLAERVIEFIDDAYVEEAYDTEYPTSWREDSRHYYEVAEEYDGEEYDYEEYDDEEYDDYEVDNDDTCDFESSKRKKSENTQIKSEKESLDIPPLLEIPASIGSKTAEKVSDCLEDIIKSIYKDSFAKYLQQLINKKGLKNSEVYATANISKQYFSKLLNGNIKPSKEKMLALAVGLKLNSDEMTDFLRFAGYAISPISQTDMVVEYFIRHKDYNVIKIDIVLYDLGLEPLSS